MPCLSVMNLKHRIYLQVLSLISESVRRLSVPCWVPSFNNFRLRTTICQVSFSALVSTDMPGTCSEGFGSTNVDTI